MARLHALSESVVLLAVSCIGLRGADAPPVELELAHAWSVRGPGRFDASGLALRNDDFFVVSDRHNDSIFRLAFSGEEARAETLLRFTGPVPYPAKGYLDLEAIAVAPDGGFYVVAEWGFAVAYVPAQGGQATWATPELRGVGQTVGLFATADAYLEGVALLGDQSFLVAVERQPRGVVEVTGGIPPVRVCAQILDGSRHPIPGTRKWDFSDLCVWGDRVFALARNQHLVVELRRDVAGAWTEGDAWSYGQTENAAPYRFSDMTYGQGEGLAIDDRFIYVLLDNNDLAREGQPGDKRTWLFAFRNVIGDPALVPQ
jgi:hypothetical protein